MSAVISARRWRKPGLCRLSMTIFPPVIVSLCDGGSWSKAMCVTVRDLRHVIEGHRVTHVVHCAAGSLVAKSMAEPDLFHSVNVEGTQTLLDAMQACGCRSIVLDQQLRGLWRSARCAGEARVRPVRRVNPYGRTKLTAETMLAERRGEAGFQATTLRLFNAAGADPAGDVGESHDPETHLCLAPSVRRWTASIFAFSAPLMTNAGWHGNPRLRACVRCRAHRAGAEASSCRVGRAARTISAADEARPVKEILAGVEAVSGRSVPVVHGARVAQGDPPRIVADISLARAALGFAPQRSDLPSIVRRCLCLACQGSSCPSPEPLVSIVMSMQDSAATLAPAIRSIQRQTLTDWELILLDDGSRDNSAEIAASFQ